MYWKSNQFRAQSDNRLHNVSAMEVCVSRVQTLICKPSKQMSDSETHTATRGNKRVGTQWQEHRQVVKNEHLVGCARGNCCDGLFCVCMRSVCVCVCVCVRVCQLVLHLMLVWPFQPGPKGLNQLVWSHDEQTGMKNLHPTTPLVHLQQHWHNYVVPTQRPHWTWWIARGGGLCVHVHVCVCVCMCVCVFCVCVCVFVCVCVRVHVIAVLSYDDSADETKPQSGQRLRDNWCNVLQCGVSAVCAWSMECVAWPLTFDPQPWLAIISCVIVPSDVVVCMIGRAHETKSRAAKGCMIRGAKAMHPSRRGQTLNYTAFS